MLSRVFTLAAVLLAVSSTALARPLSPLVRAARAFPAPPILAHAGIVIDADSGAVLTARNEHLRLPMASTTKIMTAVVALQMGHLDDRITVPSAAFDYEWDATVMGLHAGQTVTLRDLLYGLMLPSGADAANTIAIHYGGSEARFVALMNAEAAQLGLRDTHYVNAHGLTAHNHYSSAYDLARLGQYAAALPDLMTIAGARAYNWNGHVLTNVNRVLFWYPGLDGIKPGYTDDAGLCQVLDAHRGGRHVIAALLNTPNLDTDARNLLNYGLRDFSWVQSRLPGDGPWTVQSGADGAGPWMYFPASGHYIRGAFLAAYRASGSAAALGYPRTEQLSDGDSLVQYFQNGALGRSGSGQVHRLPLGLTPLPTPSATPLPTATATPPGPPVEATVGTGSGPRKTPTPQPRATATPAAVKAAAPPSVTLGPTATAPIFRAFQQRHARALGAAVSPPHQIGPYRIQLFAYGALAYSNRTHAVMLLPIGDRLLGARGFLPRHPGDTYPAGFAPGPILKATGWLISGSGYRVSNQHASTPDPATRESMPVG